MTYASPPQPYVHPVPPKRRTGVMAGIVIAIVLVLVGLVVGSPPTPL